MEYMKIVFLQDSALVRRLYPDHPIFAHEVFRNPEYRKFAAKIIDAEDNPEIPHNNPIQAIVPEISGSLRGIRQENQASFHVVLKVMALSDP
jgi:Centromere DNA-binding protein complex CBF3 subunit, domain 2